MMALQMKIEDQLFDLTGVEAQDFAGNMERLKIGNDPEFKQMMQEYVQRLQATMAQKQAGMQ